MIIENSFDFIKLCSCSSFFLLNKIACTHWHVAVLYLRAPLAQVAAKDLRGDVNWNILEPVLAFLRLLLVGFFIVVCYFWKGNHFLGLLLHKRNVDVLHLGERCKAALLRVMGKLRK
jgi:hypothetical protein